MIERKEEKAATKKREFPVPTLFSLLHRFHKRCCYMISFYLTLKRCVWMEGLGGEGRGEFTFYF